MPAEKDHPRSRGVYAALIAAWRQTFGSSPLARGLRVRWDSTYRDIGIIPARAGSTFLGVYWPYGGADHPRSRGVYVFGTEVMSTENGSSPLARGLPRTTTRSPQRSRIIPARAGSTRRRVARWAAMSDHPRSRGVYGRPVGLTHGEGGSSPLARGLPGAGEVGGEQAGIIPARAGSTFFVTGQYIKFEDHPRSRGVYGRERRGTLESGGSSPLARGLHYHKNNSWNEFRIIPARAGSTIISRRAMARA